MKERLIALTVSGCMFFNAMAYNTNGIELSGAEVQSAAVYCIESGECIASVNENKRLTPASITKLYTTAAAMQKMGGEACFTTEAYYSNGGIFVLGGGDPTVKSRSFNGNAIETLASDISAWQKKTGKAITSLTLSSHFLQGEQTPGKRLWEDMGNYYGGAPGAFVIGDNVREIILDSPQGVGQHCRVVKTNPVWHGPIKSYVTTYSGTSDSAYVFGYGDGGWYVSGSIPSGRGSFKVKAALTDAAELYAGELKRELSKVGINIGNVSVTDALPHGIAGAELIAVSRSHKLKAIIKQTNNKSVNLFADALLLQLGADGKGAGRTTSYARSVEALNRFAKETTDGISDPVFYDGSGLSPMNRISARQMVNLLIKMHADADWVGSLPLVGSEGTVASWAKGTRLQGAARAKTGTLNDVVSYAGYVTHNNRRYAFCVIINGAKETKSELRRKIAAWLEQNVFTAQNNNVIETNNNMKTVIYQIFTRLYGNTNATRKFDGTIEENGCGKMNDINDAALADIAASGYTHVWYTGVLRHASTTNYSFMKTLANPNVVKGRAGSPYAICDYYDIDPDLAVDPDKRMQEFEALVERTHKHGLKVIIDLVPNHVARNYNNDSDPLKPVFGATDDVNRRFDAQNNFYYLPGEQFVQPVGNRSAEEYHEFPAKVSGNDAFTARPSVNDWYETVKLNYGHDYDANYQHTYPKPDTWVKVRDIVAFWAKKGVDGFRTDMAEMVPVEFWSWMIRQITERYPKVKFIAEVYNTARYREFVNAGFHYLYDKSYFYDTIRAVAEGKCKADVISNIWKSTDGIGRNMLYFLENHDEQRIASEFFLGDGRKAKSAMLLAALMGQGATMVYFGQELGEPAMESEGFSGKDGRSTIFDYWGIDLVQKYVGADHSYTGAALPEEAKDLKNWYSRVLNLTQKYEAFSLGSFYDLMWVNQGIFVNAQSIYAFLRYYGNQRFLVIANFAEDEVSTYIKIPKDAWELMGSKYNESIQPVCLLGEMKDILHTSVEKIEERGLKVSIPAKRGLVLKF